MGVDNVPQEENKPKVVGLSSAKNRRQLEAMQQEHKFDNTHSGRRATCAS